MFHCTAGVISKHIQGNPDALYKYRYIWIYICRKFQVQAKCIWANICIEMFSEVNASMSILQETLSVIRSKFKILSDDSNYLVPRNHTNLKYAIIYMYIYNRHIPGGLINWHALYCLVYIHKNDLVIAQKSVNII